MSPFFEALLKKITKKNAVQHTNASDEAEEILNPLYQESIEKKGSLLRPKLPGVKSIKKNLVLILLLLFGAIFAISFMYSMKKKDVPIVANQNTAAAMTSNEADTKLSYSDILKNNNNGKPTNGNGNGMNLNNGMNPNNGQVYQADPYVSNRTAYIPNEGRYSNYSNQRPVLNVSPMSADDGTYGYLPNYLSNPYQQNMGRQNAQGNAPETIEKKDSYLRSAIGFNLGGNDSSNNATKTNIGASTYYNASQNTLNAGSIIPVTLLTGIDSDLPSQVVCQVRENVYDSITGDVLLIPQGAKIIGDVNNGVIGAAQERIAVTWKRMILPNGYSVNLGNMAAVDSSGYPGLKDKVNSHTGKIFSATLLTSLISAAAQIASGNTSSDDQSSRQLAVSGAAGNILNAGSKILERNININPTIQISPGTIFNIFVNDDLVLRPYE